MIPHANRLSFAGKLAFIVFLFWLSFYEIQGDQSSVFHAINVVFHEAGHPIFGLLGEFMGFLGGTLGQVLIPSIVALHFWSRRDWYATAIAGWWMSANLLDIGIYMADARIQVLPLIGGEHDWYYLFGSLGLLNQDVVIGNAVWTLGCIGMVIALFIAGAISLRQMQKI